MDWKENMKDPEWFLTLVVLLDLDPLQVDRIIKDVRKQQEQQATEQDGA
jgi:hypothetical protein